MQNKKEKKEKKKKSTKNTKRYVLVSNNPVCSCYLKDDSSCVREESIFFFCFSLSFCLQKYKNMDTGAIDSLAPLSKPLYKQQAGRHLKKKS
jgi:hypothetical protein